MVNAWITKSLAIGNGPGYLDNLHEIYPLKFYSPREISTWEAIEDAHKRQDGPELLDLTLGLKRFPVEFAYAAIMKQRRHIVKQNPKMAKMVADKLLSMSIDDLRRECLAPQKTSTTVGNMFRSWSTTRMKGVKVFDDAKKFKQFTGVGILSGSDDALMDFANAELKAGVSKGLDLVAKNGAKYVIGEAKLLGSTGGNQDKSFQDISKLVRDSGGLAKRIGVIDGYIWINKATSRKSKGPYDVVRESDHVFLSALLLEDFLKNGL